MKLKFLLIISILLAIFFGPSTQDTFEIFNDNDWSEAFNETLQAAQEMENYLETKLNIYKKETKDQQKQQIAQKYKNLGDNFLDQQGIFLSYFNKERQQRDLEIEKYKKQIEKQNAEIERESSSMQDELDDLDDIPNINIPINSYHGIQHGMNMKEGTNEKQIKHHLQHNTQSKDKLRFRKLRVKENSSGKTKDHDDDVNENVGKLRRMDKPIQKQPELIIHYLKENNDQSMEQLEKIYEITVDGVLLNKYQMIELQEKINILKYEISQIKDEVSEIGLEKQSQLESFEELFYQTQLEYLKNLRYAKEPSNNDEVEKSELEKVLKIVGDQITEAQSPPICYMYSRPKKICSDQNYEYIVGTLEWDGQCMQKCESENINGFEIEFERSFWDRSKCKEICGSKQSKKLCKKGFLSSNIDRRKKLYEQWTTSKRRIKTSRVGSIAETTCADPHNYQLNEKEQKCVSKVQMKEGERCKSIGMESCMKDWVCGFTKKVCNKELAKTITQSLFAVMKVVSFFTVPVIGLLADIGQMLKNFWSALDNLINGSKMRAQHFVTQFEDKFKRAHLEKKVINKLQDNEFINRIVDQILNIKNSNSNSYDHDEIFKGLIKKSVYLNYKSTKQELNQNPIDVPEDYKTQIYEMYINFLGSYQGIIENKSLKIDTTLSSLAENIFGNSDYNPLVKIFQISTFVDLKKTIMECYNKEKGSYKACMGSVINFLTSFDPIGIVDIFKPFFKESCYTSDALTQQELNEVKLQIKKNNFKRSNQINEKRKK